MLKTLNIDMYKIDINYVKERLISIMIKHTLRPLKPTTGTRSQPVKKRKNFFLSSILNSIKSTSQNH